MAGEGERDVWATVEGEKAASAAASTLELKMREVERGGRKGREEGAGGGGAALAPGAAEGGGVCEGKGMGAEELEEREGWTSDEWEEGRGGLGRTPGF